MSAVIEKTEVRQEHAEPKGRGFGWYGMVFFLSSEAVFFANLIAAYLYLRVRDGSNWPHHIGTAEIILPAINTVVLLSSSFPMHFAGRAIIRGDRNALARNLLFTVVLGALFLSGQAYEYTHSPFGPSTDIFGSVFFTLTGFHGAHVTFGVLFLLICFLRSINGHFSKSNHFAITAVEMYWHFVDAVWIVLFS
ncbi:MAG TPA: cytochrome c oxidase subunit 3, partial [Ktedonobacterales bacterium]|nr:cytochrome c oxidase subunit 3 [Ktedonobacterales bacterium]